MNKFLLYRKYYLFFLITITLNSYVLGKERNCSNYPYPNGIHIKSNFMKKNQFIYTKSISIKSKNIRKIEFKKKQNNIFAIASLNNHIRLNSSNKKEEKIGVYRIYSCFDSDYGIYKISYAQRVNRLKNFNIIQKVKNFFKNKFYDE